MSANRVVYIVLTSTGTYLSKLIQIYTKASFNHASIAFDPELKEVYSFGRKNVANPFLAGLVREDYSSPFFHASNCAIYTLSVTTEQYDQMHRLVRNMMKKQHTYKYHLLGLIGVMLQVELRRENAYFCSQFVSHVLGHGGALPVRKPAHFVIPSDFENTDILKEVYRGNLWDYILQPRERTIPINSSSSIDRINAHVV